jgi:hypothetical protein
MMCFGKNEINDLEKYQSRDVGNRKNAEWLEPGQKSDSLFLTNCLFFFYTVPIFQAPVVVL